MPRTALFLAAVLLSSASLPAPAQPADISGLQPPNIAGKPNAALDYFRAWFVLDESTRKRLGHNDDKDQARLLADNQEYIESIIRAANTTDCDWGVQYENGFEALLPHLGPLRSSARALAADAQRLATQGGAVNSAAAASRVAAILRMHRQVRADGLMISSLVGVAVTTLGESTARSLLEQNLLTAGDAQTILNAAREVAAEDPFGVRYGVVGEGAVLLEWGKRRFTGKDAAKEFSNLIVGFGADRPSADAQLLQSYSEQQLHDGLDRAMAYYKDVTDAWEKADAEDQLARIEERLKDGDYGLVARMVAPAATNALKADRKGRKAVADLKAALEAYIAAGGKFSPAKKDAPTK